MKTVICTRNLYIKLPVGDDEQRFTTYRRIFIKGKLYPVNPFRSNNVRLMLINDEGREHHVNKIGWGQYFKEVKVLSDGNQAKVGMIVVLIYEQSGNKVGTITKITKTLTKITKTLTLETHVACEAINSTLWEEEDNSYNNLIHCKTPSWWEALKNLRKATAEERKQYYHEKQRRLELSLW